MTTATPGSAALLAQEVSAIIAHWFPGKQFRRNSCADAIVARLAAKPDEDGVREAIIALVEKSMRDTWNEICSDTECHPDDIEHGRGKVLSFEPKHWARFTGEAVADALSTKGHPKP